MIHRKVHEALQVGGNRITGLQGNLLPEPTGEKLVYIPSHKSLYPFQKAFCFAFETASFLPSNYTYVCVCTCPHPLWESLIIWRYNPFSCPTAYCPQEYNELQKLNVPSDREHCLVPILYVVPFNFIDSHKQLTVGTTISSGDTSSAPATLVSPTCFTTAFIDRKSILKVLFVLTSLLSHLPLCFLILYVFFGFSLFPLLQFFMHIFPAGYSQSSKSLP